MSLTLKQRADAVRRANDPEVFPSVCRITRMDGSVGPIELTGTQHILVWYFIRHAWTYTNKYRQAASSTVHVADQLRYVSYTPGAMGMVIGDKEDTYKELIRRQGIMYNSLHEAIQTPLARPTSSEMISFAHPHDGLIQGITGGGDSPAIGFSPDYALLSEYGLYTNYTAFDGAFFPAISRRPNAKCRIETTPGVYNSPAHEMYRQALAGKGRFQAVFLAWWQDRACAVPPPRDFEPTPEEKDYRRKIALFEEESINKKSWYAYPVAKPVTDGHLYFRRLALETEFHGDPRLFDTKYPPSPFEGWAVSSSPTIPMEPLAEMLRTARPVQYGEEVFFEDREHGCPYLITVDGKGYGKKGDPAAMTLWNMWDWKEAGSWSGDEDPGQIAPRILRWQRLYDADVIVETNKDGVAAALQAANCPKLHWSGAQPGWYSTEASKSAALIALVNMLRAREVRILSEPTLNQLSTWDGKTRAQESGRRKHHWDRAITCLIFAYAVQVLGHQRRPQPPPPESRVMTVGRFLSGYETTSKGRVLGQ